MLGAESAVPRGDGDLLMGLLMIGEDLVVVVVVEEVVGVVVEVEVETEVATV